MNPLPRDITIGQRWVFHPFLGGPDRQYEVVSAEGPHVMGSIVTLANVETGKEAYPSRHWMRSGPETVRGTWEHVGDPEPAVAA